MKNYAWINTDNNLVENIIYYDGETPLVLPDNVILVEYPNEGIKGSWSMLSPGWSYVNGQFVEPPEPTRPETIIAPDQPNATGSQTL
jgi:hypothetical protein